MESVLAKSLTHLAYDTGLADSLESVTSPFDSGNLFVKELEPIKSVTKFLGTQNQPHD